MTTVNFVFMFIVAACVNVVTASDDDYQDQSIKARTVGRAYSLSTCNYKLQVGYTCLACNRALHCYPGDIAILVDCYGPFRYCRDGRCSRYQGDKCFSDNKLTTPGPSNDTMPTHTEITENAGIASSEATTRLVTGALTESIADTVTQKVADTVTENAATIYTESVATTNVESVTETVIIPIDETASTISDVSSTNSVEDPSSNVV